MAYKPRVLTAAEGGTGLTSPGSSGNVLTSNGSAWVSSPASGGALSWSEVTGTSQSAAVNTGYITNNAALVTVSLPSTFALGSVIRVANKGAGGFSVVAAAGDTIIFGTQSSSAGGSATFTATGDCIELLCITADTTWRIISSVGNITLA